MNLRLALLFGILLFQVEIVHAQEKKGDRKEGPKEIELLHADRFTVDETTPKGASKLIGAVRLQHENVLMFCDSAYLYDDNSLDAFGNVKIIDGDSLTMLGDSLFYNGNERLAKIRGNVIIDNQASVLKTNFLDYYRETGMAHYYGGGEIDSEKEKIHLVSEIGYYFSEAKLFHFKQDVVMNHPDYVIVTDTMHYAPDQEKTWFFGPTDIDSDDRHIYCEYGWFDQLSEKAKFIRNAQINSSGQILKGDTIDRDGGNEIGIARCNVELIDTNERFEVNGDYALYDESDSTSLVTRNMLLMQDMEGDTFFLIADTLYSFVDTTGNRIIRTYHHNRFYKTDMQGACDSLIYHSGDSIIYMYQSPILWSDENQITADSIRMTMLDGLMDKMYMDQNAFIIAREDSVFFNQIKGRDMIGYFKDEELHKVDVFGNGETIYYPREEDNTLIGVNETKCANMTIRIDSNTINKISFYDQPTAVLTPSDDMTAGGNKLKDFDWRIDERPASKEELLQMRWARMDTVTIVDTNLTDTALNSNDSLTIDTTLTVPQEDSIQVAPEGNKKGRMLQKAMGSENPEPVAEPKKEKALKEED